MSILIVGGGIGGLTLALQLHARGIPCRVYEAVSSLQRLGVGINLLPHAMKEFATLELDDAIVQAGVSTRNYRFYNRFGQLIHTEARGLDAGYPWPQVSLHRGILHQLLLRTVLERLGSEAVSAGRRFVFAEQTGRGVTAAFELPDGKLETVNGELLIGCDGIRSAVRRQIYPLPDPLRYSGITMWRGVTRWQPILDGATMIYAGWLETGKMLAYPISEQRDDEGRQLINWICEFNVAPRDPSGDWSREGRIDDFLHSYEDMRFDFLDVPAFVRAAEYIYEYPMVDRDPIEYWSDGRITLLGDAAHPMTPRGSNGAGQAIIDARVLAELLATTDDPLRALHEYDDIRRPQTARVVEANRAEPPDAILREVYVRTGDKPFDSIEDVISRAELQALSERYKVTAGFSREQL